MYFFCLNNINLKYTFSVIQQVEVYLKYILKYASKFQITKMICAFSILWEKMHYAH